VEEVGARGWVARGRSGERDGCARGWLVRCTGASRAWELGSIGVRPGLVGRLDLWV
jgi:hypothetical protein